MPNASRPTLRPTLAEIYNTLNQLIDAYGAVMMAFQSTSTDLQDLRNEVADLKEFNRGLLTDAVASREIWRGAAEAHKAEADHLRQQLAELLEGCTDG